MKKIVYCGKVAFLVIAAMMFVGSLQSQTNVLDPNDPIVVYDPLNPPTQPPFGQIKKWVKTDRMNWNTSSFKSYIYKGMAFRLKFPKSYQHGANDLKTYPLIMFLHGVGERGQTTDNEFQLYHGGYQHLAAVDNDQFDGFLFYPQNISGFFGATHYAIFKELFENFFVPQIKLDINRISVHGLSGGASSTWDLLIQYPKLYAAGLPMSAASLSYTSSVNNFKHIKVWHFQGELDNSPSPATSTAVGNAILAVGGNYKYTEYEGVGHGTWFIAHSDPEIFRFMLSAHKANPWPSFGRTEFCPGDAINVTLGVSAGFDGYEWRKNGQPIAGTANEITVNSTGVYDCRIRRGTTWSVWSPIPVEIKLKTATVVPPIQISGMMSRVIPAPDGNTSVKLELPGTFATYQWRKTGSSTILGTTPIFTATSAGDYIVTVTEQFGCASNASAPFTVIDANGPNKPDAPTNVLVSTLSKTQLQLTWSNNPAPVNNETNFEIYQASAPGGTYKLVALTGPDVLSYTVNGLNSNQRYYFIIRAINNTGASAATLETSGITSADLQAPAAPSNLVITTSSPSSITLNWDPAIDDVGISKYDIYVNGVKSYVTNQPPFVVHNLETGKIYNFRVGARDPSNNFSPLSNQVTGQPLLVGLTYKNYAGTFNNLPDFNVLTPVATGVVPNITLTNTVPTSNYAFLWQGYLNITIPGTYTFGTQSTDGSRVYIGPAYQGVYSNSIVPLVNNDGVHGLQVATGSINLTAGVHPIAITYFRQGTGGTLNFGWITPGSTEFQLIPDAAYAQPSSISASQIPVTPSTLTAITKSNKRIDLNWTDNSNNETGFEISRSTNQLTGFSNIGTTQANATSYIDGQLNPGTTYYYRLRAVNLFGESGFTTSSTEANWKLDNNYTDASGSNKILIPTGNPAFDASTKMEGTHSLRLNGTNQSLAIGQAGGFLQENYSERSIVFWMRSNVNTDARLVFDIGGSDNGLVMALHENVLYAGVTSNSTIGLLTSPYSSTDWNHIALVYKQNTLKLYVNGVEVASNNNLGFNSVGTTTNGSGIGQTNGTNAFNVGTGYFNGWIDKFGIYSAALSADLIQAIRNNTYTESISQATTLSSPPVPAVPRNLAASIVNPTTATITWLDNASNEDNFQLYRSVNNNTNYTLVATLPANSSSYTDATLTGTSLYYYTIRAANTFGSSEEGDTIKVSTSNTAPVLGNLVNITIRSDQTQNVPVSATDNAGDVITLSATGLPAFASFNDQGNGTGSIQLSPVRTDIGTYEGIVVKARDGLGAVSEKTFRIVVTDKDIVSYYVNFNQLFPAPEPWNNFNNTPVAGRNIAALKDEAGMLSVIRVTLTDGLTGANILGAVSGDNSGRFPDDVMKTAFYESTTTAKRIRITGLPTGTKRYNLVFFGSRVGSENRSTVYSSGGNSVTLNASNNISNTVQINGLVPDATGMIEFTVARGSGSLLAFLNAMVIQSYDASATPLAPANLKITNKTKTSLQLNWDDQSNNETGFEVYRSATQNGTYTLQATVPANVNTYTDPTLPVNSRYFYKVRSKANAIFSPYSNIITAATYTYLAYVNFNRDNPAGLPWNNTDNVPQEEDVYPNLLNDQNFPTGLDMKITKGFSGENPFGMNTGNNSGVFPDNVIRSSWWLDAGVSSQLKISGLNQAMEYDFIFFGSRNGTGDRTTVYSINGKSVALNAALNISQTVQINNIRPDENGDVFIDISLGASSQFGYLGALVIQASLSANPPGGSIISAGDPLNSGLRENDPGVNLITNQANQALTEVQVFPNPFKDKDQLTIKGNFNKPQPKVTVRITDMNGRLVYMQDFSNIGTGIWMQRLNVTGKITGSGIYLVQVRTTDGGNPFNFKIISVR